MSYLGLFMGAGMGIVIFGLLIVIAWYVLCSYSHMKALNALGYDKSWLAWIPFGVYYACAEAVAGQDEKVKMFDSWEVPSMVFNLCWIVPVAFLLLPFPAALESIINLALNIIFLGSTYAKMYARFEGKTEKDTQALGCVSGFLPIIAVVKFFMYK